MKSRFCGVVVARFSVEEEVPVRFRSGPLMRPLHLLLCSGQYENGKLVWKNHYKPPTVNSLADISAMTKCTRFRVRDVETLEDLFMIYATNYTQNVPVMFVGVKLGGKDFTRLTFNAREKKFAILSSKKECEWWAGMQETQAVFQAKRSYHHLGL